MLGLFFLAKECIADTFVKSKFSYLPFPMKIVDDEVHLSKTMDWLIRGYQNGRGGVSSHYSLISGRWLKSFPETTGYIIPTIFDYSRHSGDKRYFNIGVDLADWLGDVQLPNGACMQGTYDSKEGKNKPIVFNSGQNIFGFLRAYHETKNEKYLNYADKAGNFLVKSTDEKGLWNTNLHHDIPHTYNSRTAWALLDLYEVAQSEKYRKIAIKNLDWVLSQQKKKGWFDHANSKPGELPNTHSIAYTVRGLLESYLITENSRYLDAAKLTANKLLRLFEIRKFIYTLWDEKWRNHGKYFKKGKGSYICLTGNIQFSIIWMKLFKINGDFTYLNSAFKMLDFVKTLQNIRTREQGVNGGVKGTFPIYGSYSVFKYPNWAAKFFADALMMKIYLMKHAF